MKANNRIFEDNRNKIQEEINKRIRPISIDEQEYKAKSTFRKKINPNSPRQTSPQIIDIQVEPNQIELQQQINCKQKAKRFIQIQLVQSLLKNTNIQSLRESVQNLFKQGIQVHALTKRALQKKKNTKNQPIIFYEKMNIQTSTNQFQQNLYQKSKENQIFNPMSLDEDQRQEIQIFSCQRSSENKMMYWFNNDAKIYADYQHNPYQNGDLMWTQEEDTVLEKANCDFVKNSADLNKLIKTKSAEMVKKRIDFLKIQMNESLQFYIESIQDIDKSSQAINELSV